MIHALNFKVVIILKYFKIILYFVKLDSLKNVICKYYGICVFIKKFPYYIYGIN